MTTERPVRRMDPSAAQFWEFTKEREFRLQRCSDCGKFRWPPAPICEQCLSEAFDWTLLTGQGTVVSWVIFRRAYFSEYAAPHYVVTVELDEGPLFISNPVEMDTADLKDGLRVSLRWLDGHDRFGDYNLPVFGPARV